MGDGDAPRWRGVNHLALITTDMDATTRFWVGALGARLVATIGTPAFRHYFFEVGAGSTVAFFEYRGVSLERFAKPAGVPDPRAPQFDHLALGVADLDALTELRDRLAAAGCDVTGIVDHGFLRSIYFTDPNGIALEASCWVLDPTGHAAPDPADRRVFADPDPVPAARELAAGGRPEPVPATRLVDAPTGRPDDWVTPA